MNRIFFTKRKKKGEEEGGGRGRVRKRARFERRVRLKGAVRCRRAGKGTNNPQPSASGKQGSGPQDNNTALLYKRARTRHKIQYGLYRVRP